MRRGGSRDEPCRSQHPSKGFKLAEHNGSKKLEKKPRGSDEKQRRNKGETKRNKDSSYPC
jgi:hypothetical protein